jgi:hypothetical protein
MCVISWRPHEDLSRIRWSTCNTRRARRAFGIGQTVISPREKHQGAWRLKIQAKKLAGGPPVKRWWLQSFFHYSQGSLWRSTARWRLGEIINILMLTNDFFHLYSRWSGYKWCCFLSDWRNSSRDAHPSSQDYRWRVVGVRSQNLFFAGTLVESGAGERSEQSWNHYFCFSFWCYFD